MPSGFQQIYYRTFYQPQNILTLQATNRKKTQKERNRKLAYVKSDGSITVFKIDTLHRYLDTGMYVYR